MLEVKHLSFAYARRPVFEDVSFSVAAGETVALVGRNGAGKSTLLRVMATLAVPFAGGVSVDGVDVFAHALRYRRMLGYVGENAAGDPDLTVRRYLRYHAALRGEQTRKIRHRVAEAIDRCGLGEQADRPVGLLSFGHRRRLALADAILLRPRILLVDDPFAGLDPAASDAIASVFASLASFASVVVAGHAFDALAACTQRFLVIENGRVREAPDADAARKAASA